MSGGFSGSDVKASGADIVVMMLLYAEYHFWKPVSEVGLMVFWGGGILVVDVDASSFLRLASSDAR